MAIALGHAVDGPDAGRAVQVAGGFRRETGERAHPNKVVGFPHSNCATSTLAHAHAHAHAYDCVAHTHTERTPSESSSPSEPFRKSSQTES
jgi:hypothetical protein